MNDALGSASRMCFREAINKVVLAAMGFGNHHNVASV